MKNPFEEISKLPNPISIRQLSQFLDLREDVVKKMISNGLIKTTQYRGGQMIFHNEIEKFIDHYNNFKIFNY